MVCALMTGNQSPSPPWQAATWCTTAHCKSLLEDDMYLYIPQTLYFARKHHAHCRLEEELRSLTLQVDAAASPLTLAQAMTLLQQAEPTALLQMSTWLKHYLLSWQKMQWQKASWSCGVSIPVPLPG